MHAPAASLFFHNSPGVVLLKNIIRTFIYVMGKSLSQITFEFSGGEPAVVPVSKPAIKPQPETVKPVEIKKEKKPSTRGRRSLKEMGINADLIQIPTDDILFSKQYYPIGEVAAMFRENQSLIRYWETEFDILQPRKNRKGDRFFRPIDIKNLVMIYDLLRRRKFTIEGAKDYLKKTRKAEEKFAMIQSLEKIKAFLLELKASL
jgi:DNA-binding transcriptional MerR regulator